ncbi:hypothetical protein GOBAR_DD13643 [Gossypium barbadense]|nr:hypothetical protein GOBAR_DD13643 [Gossypium barbadense]
MEKGNRQVVVSALQFACTDDVPTNLATVESCSLETLSTLKFAQLVKFIKNNAVVNEDASGDVVAMRLQIQQLKLMDINESPLNVLLNPAINPTQKIFQSPFMKVFLIILWNLEIGNLTEVITSAEFHPAHCNMLAYSSSKKNLVRIQNKAGERHSMYCLVAKMATAAATSEGLNSNKLIPAFIRFPNQTPLILNNNNNINK